MDEYPRIGLGQPNLPIYEFDVYDFLCKLEPPPSFKMDPIDPVDYFITSGEAIQKTKYLCKVLWENAGRARKRLGLIKKPTKKDKAFEKECWEQAGKANKMLNELKKARGENVFLETEWRDSTLLVLAKNPRS